ncbi:putative RRM domain-containing protein [Seiridium unicorne]|uniref:RRM domain-containing protein n=2 Tax=Seiridium TaxID=138063 RepID=A0ABR2V340_9PEZI
MTHVRYHHCEYPYGHIEEREATPAIKDRGWDVPVILPPPACFHCARLKGAKQFSGMFLQEELNRKKTDRAGHGVILGQYLKLVHEFRAAADLVVFWEETERYFRGRVDAAASGAGTKGPLLTKAELAFMLDYFHAENLGYVLRDRCSDLNAIDRGRPTHDMSAARREAGQLTSNIYTLLSRVWKDDMMLSIQKRVTQTTMQIAMNDSYCLVSMLEGIAATMYRAMWFGSSSNHWQQWPEHTRPWAHLANIRRNRQARSTMLWLPGALEGTTVPTALKVDDWADVPKTGSIAVRAILSTILTVKVPDMPVSSFTSIHQPSARPYAHLNHDPDAFVIPDTYREARSLPYHRDMSRAGKLAPEVNRALFVKNLSYTVTPEDLFELFGKFGPIRQVRQGIATNTKGTAFVVYEDVMDAKQACDKLNGFNFQGRYLVDGPAAALQTTRSGRTSADPSISSTSTSTSSKASSIVKPVTTPIPVKKKEAKLAAATKVATTRKGRPDDAAEQARRNVLSFVRSFLPQKTSNKMVMT